MAVTDSYRALVLEQFDRAVQGVRARRMFGGVGLYSGDAFFALIADDTLFFKTDPVTRREFEERGMPPFQPFGHDGMTMHYHQLPEEILEDPESLRAWAERAIAVARRAKKAQPKRRRGA